MTNMPAVLGFLAATALMSPPAWATSLADFTLAGYQVVRTTYFAGAFHGCGRGERLAFADGTVMDCGRAHSQYLYQPNVYILRKGPEPASAIIIGGQAYNGRLTQLGSRLLPSSLPLDDDSAGFVALAPRRGGISPTRPLEPIQSLNQMQNQLSQRLNDAQQDPISKPYAHRKDE